jgi:hypothetical protein
MTTAAWTSLLILIFVGGGIFRMGVSTGSGKVGSMVGEGVTDKVAEEVGEGVLDGAGVAVGAGGKIIPQASSTKMDASMRKMDKESKRLCFNFIALQAPEKFYRIIAWLKDTPGSVYTFL